MRNWSLAVFVCLTFAASTRRADAQCPDWRPGFQAPGIGGDGHALLVHDFGQGPRLVVGGEHDLTSPDTSAESSVLVWDGLAWTSLAGGPPGTVRALVAWDDGTGTALYAGGTFSSAGGSGVSRWNGVSWTPLGSGVNGTVHALAVFDDGTGSALYVGGEFNLAGGQTVGRVARWNGSTWSVVGTAPAIGPNNAVLDLTVFDDGTGSALYAGGAFTGVGGSGASRVAKWDGTSWSALGSGVNSAVDELIVHDDGSGPALYVGGQFWMAGGQPVFGIARWNGASWSALGSGLGSQQQVLVRALGVYDDGSGAGPRLHVSGDFTLAGGTPASGFAIWDGASWSTPDTRLDAHAFETFDAGAGRVLVATGPFASVGSVHAVGLALWNGSVWTPPNSGLGISLGYPGDNESGGYVSVLRKFDDGSGHALYAAGAFAFAGTSAVQGCARYDGQGWRNTGPTGMIYTQALETHDDGTGPALYAAGSGPVGPAVLRWNGSTWSAFAPQLEGASELVEALCSFDDGTGPALYVGGTFTGAPGVGLSNVARWDGTAWSPLGTGTNGFVAALAVFDDGTGPALYVGGDFSTAGGALVNGIARWNGATWSALGSGVSGRVEALHSFDDGSGPALYVGGHFFGAGGVTALNAARWKNSSWSALGSGVWHVSNPSLQSIKTFYGWDEGTGSGPVLLAAGFFTHAGGIVSHGIARWDGSAWSDVGGGVFDSGVDYVWGLETFDDGTGSGVDLFVSGTFELAGDKPSSRIAAWSGCDETGRTLCYGDGSGTACPCGNASAAGDRDGCVNSTGLGGRLRASGAPSLANDTLVLSGSRMTNGSALYFQGTARVNAGAGAVFGDGLRCAAGNVVRLAILSNASGSSQYPDAGDLPVATKGAVTQPGVRVYQIWFRDAASFCTPDTFSLTNAVEIVWGS